MHETQRIYRYKFHMQRMGRRRSTKREGQQLETITITITRRGDLPQDIHGAVTRENDRYTILLNTGDTPARQLAAFLEEMTHIYNGDLEAAGSVGEIENRTKRQLLEALEIIKAEGESQKRPKNTRRPGAIRPENPYIYNGIDLNEEIVLEAGREFGGYYKIVSVDGETVHYTAKGIGGVFVMKAEPFKRMIRGGH